VVRAPDVLDPEVDREPPEEAALAVLADRSAGEAELEPVRPRRERPLEEVADAAVVVGQGLGQPDRAVVLAYGLLVLVAIRAFNGEATWDLLGLVVLGGLVGLGYRLRQRVVSRRWTSVLGATVVIAAIAGLVIAALQLPR
jgi:hypothetical protein